MIINTTPENQAILSNVGEIGEFRIRNSAKAFGILSSGLYSNKIRAIIRELSCNAVDSHVAAGKKDIPFEVHLPNMIEPWFSIRDYGTGLNHDQVTNIYTTYFESTKTSSNDFIGALGLGSKSPFSYTDNFTVTAIQDKIKRIYTAFINGNGVPGIALMLEESTDEPTGVEIKFSVENSLDFQKFRSEAVYVYTYFNLRPQIVGCHNFEFNDPTYLDKDIIPGVHYNGNRSQAIMGNIAYPIEVPNAESNLGNLRCLLTCGLDIHFNIGEIEFQASREGLSYVPQTIKSIKDKLEKVVESLAIKLAKEADEISNIWKKTIFLYQKLDDKLWTTAAEKYINDTSFPFLVKDRNSYYKKYCIKKITLDVENLSKKYNLQIRGLYFNYKNVASNLKPQHESKSIGTHSGKEEYKKFWDVDISNHLNFVIDDVKTGVIERCKYHWKINNQSLGKTVYILSSVDKNRPALFQEFLESIFNPPNVFKGSDLTSPPKNQKSSLKNATILYLKKSLSRGGYGDVVWRNEGSLLSMDNSVRYYLPLNGFKVVSQKNIDAKDLYNILSTCRIPELSSLKIFGVRKTDLESIKGLTNWINLEDYITEVLSNFKEKSLEGLIINEVDNYKWLRYNYSVSKLIKNPKSPYLQIMKAQEAKNRVSFDLYQFARLVELYGSKLSFDFKKIKETLQETCEEVTKRYPLLRYVNYSDTESLAEYINIIDENKGV